MSQFIEFRDLAGNRCIFRRDAITAIMILSPLNPDKNVHSFISAGMTTAPVSSDTAQTVLQDLQDTFQ